VDLDLVRGHLDALRICRLDEWDVLVFIYHHGTSLASAEKISLLLGYTEATVGAALESLTSSGLVQRSRNSQGVRLYQFGAAVPGDSRRRSLEELMKLAEQRQGRLLLIGHLRQAAGKEGRRGGGLRLT
jgi:DNA-binding IclR family transcriptional regulator